ncbi:hypothetical protein [Sphingobium aromaticiconvertens]|uniref:hypothetical protein n=1 Tax=Sphingobium aromaticiconvertens TaxID=365341 RepID=UPI0030181555
MVEPHDDITLAIAREKALKAWQREWTLRLIEESNHDWRDISDLIFSPPETPAFAGVTTERRYPFLDKAA